MISSMVRNVGVMAPIATGGIITSDGAYTIHTFINDGTFTITDKKLADVLVVGGGGAGGSNNGAGGGGGGSVYHRVGMILVPGDYTIDIGDGGSGASNEDGYPTKAFYVNAIGGGAAHNDGASGGGHSASGVQGFGAITNWTNWESYGGYDGAPAGIGYGGGGGGGAGANGSASYQPGSYTRRAGNGGAGVMIGITGDDHYWAGGGGGSGYYYSFLSGSGGNGGGGVGATGYYPGTSGAGYNNGSHSGGANTGGGGGGAYNGNGGNGGSGIVVVRYIR
jgi:hypothetical protein